MSIHRIIGKYQLTSKKLFLIDGLGALLSAFLLGVVLVRFESLFGIPTSALYILATFPVLFAIYDLCCYLQEPSLRVKFLYTIATANILFCFLSIGMALYHREVITGMGWAYILVEICVVVILAVAESVVARRY